MNIEVNKNDLKRIENMAKSMDVNSKKVLKQVINDTAKQARKKIASRLKQVYTIKVSGVNKNLEIKKATVANLTAIVRSEGKPMPLSRYKVDFSKGGAARAKVIKTGRLKPIVLAGASKNGTDIKAFVQKLESGHIGVFQRNPNQYMKSKKPSTMKNGKQTKGRESIKQLFSNSVPAMAGNEKTIFSKIQPEINKDLRANLEKHINKLTGG